MSANNILKFMIICFARYAFATKSKEEKSDSKAPILNISLDNQGKEHNDQRVNINNYFFFSENGEMGLISCNPESGISFGKREHPKPKDDSKEGNASKTETRDKSTLNYRNPGVSDDGNAISGNSFKERMSSKGITEVKQGKKHSTGDSKDVKSHERTEDYNLDGPEPSEDFQEGVIVMGNNFGSMLSDFLRIMLSGTSRDEGNEADECPQATPLEKKAEAKQQKKNSKEAKTEAAVDKNSKKSLDSDDIIDKSEGKKRDKITASTSKENGDKVVLDDSTENENPEGMTESNEDEKDSKITVSKENDSKIPLSDTKEKENPETMTESNEDEKIDDIAASKENGDKVVLDDSTEKQNPEAMTESNEDEKIDDIAASKENGSKVSFSDTKEKKENPDVGSDGFDSTKAIVGNKGSVSLDKSTEEINKEVDESKVEPEKSSSVEDVAISESKALDENITTDTEKRGNINSDTGEVTPLKENPDGIGKVPFEDIPNDSVEKDEVVTHEEKDHSSHEKLNDNKGKVPEEDGVVTHEEKDHSSHEELNDNKDKVSEKEIDEEKKGEDNTARDDGKDELSAKEQGEISTDEGKEDKNKDHEPSESAKEK
ncbi:hypothetical protein H312_02113 [Anncaliia algerae PRA339]|uniref:Uncharacterized protein n=1 Tax=Anncaliia algerae PRA339 TaxID=1288291 RepID=A0A059F0G9_9MICR|nr:hypothetical protein H312_02113 [Anncaliia algerae PRA339]